MTKKFLYLTAAYLADGDECLFIALRSEASSTCRTQVDISLLWTGSRTARSAASENQRDTDAPGRPVCTEPKAYAPATSRHDNAPKYLRRYHRPRPAGRIAPIQA